MHTMTGEVQPHRVSADAQFPPISRPIDIVRLRLTAWSPQFFAVNPGPRLLLTRTVGGTRCSYLAWNFSSFSRLALAEAALDQHWTISHPRADVGRFTAADCPTRKALRRNLLGYHGSPQLVEREGDDHDRTRRVSKASLLCLDLVSLGPDISALSESLHWGRTGRGILVPACRDNSSGSTGQRGLP